MSEPSELVGFLCECGGHTVYVREAVLSMYGRPGETIHDIRKRMRCHRCGRKGPEGPFCLKDVRESNNWCCLDPPIKRMTKVEEP